jgi:hypothetical protein
MNSIKPFKTDGCSMFPDYKWKECCEIHDKVYWTGGTKEDRKIADKDLCKCVKEKGFSLISKLMYFGVRIGGHPLLPFPWRWGFGYKYPYNYKK